MQIRPFAKLIEIKDVGVLIETCLRNPKRTRPDQAIPLLGYMTVYAQAYWRLALMVFAALAFLGCAAILVFSNVKVARPRSRRQTAQVIPIEHEELWASHIGWLREAAVRRVA